MLSEIIIQNMNATSPLDGIDPSGRVDVLCGGILNRVVRECGDPELAQAYALIRPAVDTALMEIFGNGGRA